MALNLLDRIDRAAQRPQNNSPCVYLGDVLRLEGKPCCGQTKVYRCTKLGHETRSEQCRACEFYEPRMSSQPDDGEARPVSPSQARATKRLVLTNWQSPGDITMLTAAVRDLHKAYPGRFETDLRTSCGEIWEQNPHVTRFSEPWIDDQARRTRERNPVVPLLRDGIVFVPCTYALSRTHHFVTAFHKTLEAALGLPIPPTELKGDIHLSPDERRWMSQIQEMGVNEPFWVIATDGKWDYTAKWPNWHAIQEAVYALRGKVLFVQTGVKGNFNPPLRNVIDLVGQTSLRMLIRLIYHASGVLCSMNGVMHLAAAIERHPAHPAVKPCVVLAGGRESPTWEHYPWHRWLGGIGTMGCNLAKGCWKNRCTLLTDGDNKNGDYCKHYTEYDRPEGTNTEPVLTPKIRIAKCLDNITADDIVEAVESYYKGCIL